jgi:hypothetical protein
MLRGIHLAQAYAAADIFLHCSITETFGLVVLESMASGVPVIARAEGGPSETVKHGSSGYLVAPNDLETFVAYARRLATDDGLRVGMGGRCREQAMDTTWDRINLQVAVRLADALLGRTETTTGEADVGYYGSLWGGMCVYAAVGIVWVFWFIAVIPLILCGWAHGIFQ